MNSKHSRVLFKASEDTSKRIQQGKALEEICDKEFWIVFGKKNALEAIKRKGQWVQVPCVCCSIDPCGFFVLLSNAPDLPDEKLDELQEKIRAWYGTSLLPK